MAMAWAHIDGKQRLYSDLWESRGGDGETAGCGEETRQGRWRCHEQRRAPHRRLQVALVSAPIVGDLCERGGREVVDARDESGDEGDAYWAEEESGFGPMLSGHQRDFMLE
jgi:hypothetical protein